MFSRLKFILLIFLYLLVGQSALAAAAVQPPEQSYDTVIAEAKKGGYRLIEIDGLRQVYEQAGDDIILVDTRQDWEYHTGHIKEAVNFPMEPTWMARLTQQGALKQFLGPDKTKTIVFY
jgi:predicted sulfurtransferase